MGELVNIVWNTHMKVLRDGLWSFCQNQYKTDFTISLNNEFQNVHRLILTIFCSSLRNSDENKLVVQVEQPQIEEEDLKLLIEFMYLGRVKVCKERLPILKNVAEVLGFEVLAKAIKNFNEKIVSKIDISGSDTESVENNDRKRNPNSLQRKKICKTKNKTAINNENGVLGSAEELFLSLDGLAGEEKDKHSEENESNSEVSDWESDRIKKKRKRIIKNRKSKPSSRMRLTASKIVSRNAGSQVKYNVDKYYDPIRDGLVCKICDKILKYKSTYIRHLRCHENPELYSRCSYCDYKSDTKSALIQHLAAKHKVDPEGRQLEKNIKCSECSYTCVSDFQLKNHMYVKHTERGNVCNICGYACKSRAVYDIHLKAVHGNNERPFMCETCGFRAKTLGVLRNHLKTHSDKKTCNVCGVWLTYHSYKAHMKLHTNSERPFPCKLCNFAARKKFNLKVHLKNVHKLEDDEYLSSNNPVEEDVGNNEGGNTVTAVMINDVGEQLIEISQHAVMEAAFHMEVSEIT